MIPAKCSNLQHMVTFQEEKWSERFSDGKGKHHQ